MSGGVTEGPGPPAPRTTAPPVAVPHVAVPHAAAPYASGGVALAADDQDQPSDDSRPGPDDAALLRAHVDGDPQAFGTLVDRHADRMWAVALRVMGNPDDAADALQDAYVAAFRRAGTFRGESLVTTWLHRVVVNACLDRLRRAKVRLTDPLPDDLDRVGGLAREPERDPVEEQEQRDDVAHALATLNPDQRAALVLVDMQGYSVDEAAAILGCAPGTVKSRCARGRARLVPLLSHLRAPPDERQGAPP